MNKARWSLALLLASAIPAGAADDNDVQKERVISWVKDLKGSYQLDAKDPKRPIISVDLSRTAVTDADLANLQGLTTLRTLDLCFTKITSLRGLAGMPIEKLNLAFSQIDDAGLASVASLPSLRVLDLCSSGSITDRGLAGLHGMKSLQTLILTGTRVTNQAFRYLTKSALPNLTELDLTTTNINDALADLTELTQVQTLKLRGTPITDQALVHLKKMRHLKILDLVSTKVTMTGADQLIKSLPATNIIRTPTDTINVG